MFLELVDASVIIKRVDSSPTTTTHCDPFSISKVQPDSQPLQQLASQQNLFFETVHKTNLLAVASYHLTEIFLGT